MLQNATGPVGDQEFAYGTTLLQGIKKLAAPGSMVEYLPGVDVKGKWVTDRDRLADRARRADVIVLGVGEEAYAEASANIPDLVLPRGQHDLATLLAAESDAPIVTVLFEGRPRLLGMAHARWLVAAYCVAGCLPACPSRPRKRSATHPILSSITTTGPIPSLSQAVINAYLPGPDGGLGVAEVIFGTTNPSGRIPFTYQKHQVS